jgi:hypothetical protein
MISIRLLKALDVHSPNASMIIRVEESGSVALTSNVKIEWCMTGHEERADDGKRGQSRPVTVRMTRILSNDETPRKQVIGHI